VADNPLDLNQAIPVLLAVLLNNPNLKEGKTPSGQRDTGFQHYGSPISNSNGSLLFEFARMDRSDRMVATEWLTQRRDRACDDAVHIALHQSSLIGECSSLVLTHQLRALQIFKFLCMPKSKSTKTFTQQSMRTNERSMKRIE
jgi:hypothetical protein